MRRGEIANVMLSTLQKVQLVVLAFGLFSTFESSAQTFVRRLDVETARAYSPAADVSQRVGLAFGGRAEHRTVVDPSNRRIVHTAASGVTAGGFSAASWVGSVIDGFQSDTFRVSQNGRYELVIRGVLEGTSISGQFATVPRVPGVGYGDGILQLRARSYGELAPAAVLRLVDTKDLAEVVLTTAATATLKAALETFVPGSSEGASIAIGALVDTSWAAIGGTTTWEPTPFELRLTDDFQAGRDYSWSFAVQSGMGSFQILDSNSYAVNQLTITDLTVDLWQHSVTRDFHEVSLTAGPNGTVSPSGTILIPHGANLSVYANPDPGFIVDEWVIDSQTEGSSVSSLIVLEDRDVSVTFRARPEPDWPPTTLNIASWSIDDSIEVSRKNNGDGVLQSGEEALIRPLVRNSGETSARDIDAITRASAFPLRIDDDSVPYPDLGSGESSAPSGERALRVVPDASFSGEAAYPVRLQWGDGVYLDLYDSINLSVEPVGWGIVESEDVSVGLVEQGQPIEFQMLIRNYGTAPFVVDGFEVVDSNSTTVADTTFSRSGFSIEPGMTESVDFSIDSSALTGAIVRDVSFQTTDGRIGTPNFGRMAVTAYVSASELPSLVVGESNGASSVDVGGRWIAWVSNADVYALDLVTNETIRVTDDAWIQSRVRVSEGLIVWQDDRNSANDGNIDIYGFDLIEREEIAVSTDPAPEILAGVDCDSVAILRLYHVITSDGPTRYLYNMWIVDLLEGSERNLTGFVPAGTNPMRTVAPFYSPDFSDGLLVWSDFEVYWRGPSIDRWRSRDSSLIKFDTGADVAPVVAIPSSEYNQGATDYLASGGGEFAWVDLYEDGDPGPDSIRVWSAGIDAQQYYEPGAEIGRNTFSMGDGYILFDYRNVAGLFAWEAATGQVSLLADVIGLSSSRMDGKTAVWIAEGSGGEPEVNYRVFEQPDIALSWSSRSLDESGLYDLAIDVLNVSSYPSDSLLSVGVFGGDPELGAPALAQEQTLANGLPAQERLTLYFDDVPLPDTRFTGLRAEIIAALKVDGIDDPTNNRLLLLPEPRPGLRYGVGLLALFLVGLGCAAGCRRSRARRSIG